MRNIFKIADDRERGIPNNNKINTYQELNKKSQTKLTRTHKKKLEVLVDQRPPDGPHKAKEASGLTSYNIWHQIGKKGVFFLCNQSLHCLVSIMWLTMT